MKFKLASLALVASSMIGSAAIADVNIGVILPMTGPASGLGIPAKNALALWPKMINGEKINLIVLDDGTDPTNGVKNARRLTSEDKVDIIVGSVATPPAVAIADVAAETKTPQLALSPIPLPAGKDTWSFRLPQSNTVMSHAIVEHMKKQKIKTVGFLGYTDAYGESWLKEFTEVSGKAGIKVIATERFERKDTSVTGQALKVTSANPDAMLIVASGSGAAMPHKEIVARGYKGKIYQTHAAATRDLMRLGGKDVEGAFVVSGPCVIAEQLPNSHPSKKAAIDFVQQYEKIYGTGSRNQFAGHAYDAAIVLQKVIPQAMQKAKPGTPEFREALRNALETMGTTTLSHGTLKYTPKDHWGFTNDTGVILKVVNGDWKVE
jgi:branched-chain amino acid transport system substrate-binding protein